MPQLVVGNLKSDWVERLRPRFPDCRFADLRQLDLTSRPAVVPLHQLEYAPLWRAGQGNWVIPEAATVELCHQKPKLNAWLRQRFGGDWLPGEGLARLPAVIKLANAEAGRRCFIVHDASFIPSTLRGPEYFAQEYIVGLREYAWHFLAWHGEIHFSCIVSYDYQTAYYIRSPACKPVAVRYELSALPPPPAEEIVRALDYSGTGCMNYKIAADGSFKFIELNPRFGASLVERFGDYLAAYRQLLSSLGES